MERERDLDREIGREIEREMVGDIDSDRYRVIQWGRYRGLESDGGVLIYRDSERDIDRD